jgi:hypothetical protein|tara:strand:- start:3414 stop:4286 length:873 start_codon:yes stop_codon:yes gene_type:complete
MAVSQYFNHGLENANEQTLIENLVEETIKIYGHDVYYLPRTLVKEDSLYGEDYLSDFSQAYVIEMYIKNADGFEGEGRFLGRFGLEIRDQLTFTVSQRKFSLFSGLNNLSYERPAEGDLVFFPLSKQIFEIRYVDAFSVFYQIGNLPVYDLTCELFEYSDETLDTGISDIDTIEDTLSYALELTLGSGSGNYTVGETVYQGNTAATASTTALVLTWNSTDNVLKISDIKGTFSTSANVVGGSSTTTRSLSSAPDTQTFVNDASANNVGIESAADSVIDFSESNPFSEGNV